MQRVNLDLKNELAAFGRKNEWKECFHCGNCTAICPLTEDNFTFPRRNIRLVQMGLNKSLEKSLDPWLCYYCGECSDTCPRNANPGELMMTLRRYLTSVYDWTGISRLLYKKHQWEWGLIGMIFLLIVSIFLIFLPPARELFTNPSQFINEQGGVMINNLTPAVKGHNFVKLIETGDLIMAFLVAFLLISNIFRMFYKTILSDKNIKVPFFTYIKEAYQLVWNFAFQPRFNKCEKKNYWLGHFLLMSGYTIMFIMIVGLLPRFQIEQVVPWYNWQRLLGYYATFGLLFFLTVVTIKRIKAREIQFRFSHPSDWIFIIMLALTTISGILIHIFRLSGMPAATYFMYVFHLGVLVPMIVIEVPFSKWSHLAYRPFAVYFQRIKQNAYKKLLKLDYSKAA